MTFARPEALWLSLLAPIAVLVALLLWRRRLADARAWAASEMWRRLRLDLSRRRLAVSLAALGLAALGLALALAQPRWGSRKQLVERRGVDVVFILDSSLSMEARDVLPSRLDIAKSLVRRMVAAMPGHRVALVQAEGARVVLAPLTLDAAVIDLLMDTVYSGSLPEPGTRLAPALREGVDLFPAESERHRAIVLLSDGEDHGGGWETVVERLEEQRVIVHALGVGTVEGSPIPLPPAPGRAASAAAGPEYKQDESGQVVVSRLQEEALRGLAERSGGVYLRVDRADADPAPVLSVINDMKKRDLAGEVLDIAAERFQWPLAVAALALGLHLLLSPFGAATVRRGGEAR